MIRIYGSFSAGKHELDIPLAELPSRLERPGAVFWVLLDQPTPEEVESVAKVFHFHPLAVEDCIHYVELPKIDEFEDHAFIITHGLRFSMEGEVEKIELDCFLGKNYLVTSHLVHSRSIAHVRERVERNPEILGRGADFLLHAILDAQVDNFMPMLDTFDEECDRLEEEILENPRRGLLSEILWLRKKIVAIRRSLGPQRDVLGRLARHDLDFVTPRCSIYFRDVHDHVVRVHEMLEGIRDVVNGLTESYRSAVSHRLNEVIHRLTTISTIFLPMTTIASIFGMNFKHMPELEWTWGYPYALLLMLGVGAGFFTYFRRKQWI